MERGVICLTVPYQSDKVDPNVSLAKVDQQLRDRAGGSLSLEIF